MSFGRVVTAMWVLGDRRLEQAGTTTVTDGGGWAVDRGAVWQVPLHRWRGFLVDGRGALHLGRTPKEKSAVVDWEHPPVLLEQLEMADVSSLAATGQAKPLLDALAYTLAEARYDGT